MRLIICDDCKREREILKSSINKYFKSNNMDIEIVEFINGSDLLSSYNMNTTNIIFLDIYLDNNEITGVDVARRIRELDSHSIIIFTTVSIDHALDAFSVHAFDYLIKPIEYINLENTLNRCFSYITQPLKYIEVLSNRLLIKVNLKSILYVEVFNKYCLIHTNNGDMIKTYLTLSEIENKINSDFFLRCHRSYLINMEYIKTFTDNDFILNNNIIVPISKDKKISIKQIYVDYLFNISRK